MRVSTGDATRMAAPFASLLVGDRSGQHASIPPTESVPVLNHESKAPLGAMFVMDHLL